MTIVQVCSAQEDHGAGKRLIRVRYRLCPSAFAKLAGAACVAAVALAVHSHRLDAAASAGLLVLATAYAWRRGAALAAQVAGSFDVLAHRLNLVRCQAAPAPSRWTWNRRRRRTAAAECSE
jgi:hypothetical protein